MEKAFKEMAENGDDKLLIPAFFKEELEVFYTELKDPGLIKFYGKLKGAFGDAMQYQKNVRDEN
jgi:hypothetical protein